MIQMQNEETLDQMGKMLQSQFKPMMDAKIMSSTDKMGKVVDIKVEPMIPGMEKLKQKIMVSLIQKRLLKSVPRGLHHRKSKALQWLRTYSVRDIANGFVYLDISGEITGVAEGTISGTAEIEVSSGALKVMEMQTSMDAQNMTVKGTTKVTMTKN